MPLKSTSVWMSLRVLKITAGLDANIKTPHHSHHTTQKLTKKRFPQYQEPPQKTYLTSCLFPKYLQSTGSFIFIPSRHEILVNALKNFASKPSLS